MFLKIKNDRHFRNLFVFVLFTFCKIYLSVEKQEIVKYL